eukprot:TRINITY_DN17772_c0_g1_i6.p1 TRINITY_DN17772_c0_g1~~TRINITY_DN17772_c0_g1_i6.p1  ORF type:complete len:193 (-),score=49.59 TRINITY_DN17772_c0_g1_i6:7-585(-)
MLATLVIGSEDGISSAASSEVMPWQRDLLFGALSLAVAQGGQESPSSELAQGLAAALGNVCSADALLHALLLQSEGLLCSPSLRLLLRPLQKALDGSDYPEVPFGSSDDAGSAPETRSAAWLQAHHEPGHRGRQLTKEAHNVAKMLARIGGHGAPAPLRQPWVVKPAALGLNLLLPAGWTPDDGGLLDGNEE